MGKLKSLCEDEKERRRREKKNGSAIEDFDSLLEG